MNIHRHIVVALRCLKPFVPGVADHHAAAQHYRGHCHATIRSIWWLCTQLTAHSVKANSAGGISAQGSGVTFRFCFIEETLSVHLGGTEPGEVLSAYRNDVHSSQYLIIIRRYEYIGYGLPLCPGLMGFLGHALDHHAYPFGHFR